MRLSRYLLPVLKETPAEAQILSHRLMLRAGMIRQEAAGYLCVAAAGFRVLKNIERIVREEMDRAGAIELLMPTLQLADLWRESGRYDAYGPEMLRIRDRHERELLYGPTNEDMITEIFRASVRSYRSLPLNLYHMQWKFRDEQRPRFGVMRGREFLMKDAYSFDLDEAGARRAYNRMFVAYLRTFARMGLKAIPMRAETGPIGGDLSHEFIVLAETGESAVYCDRSVLDLPVPGDDVDYERRSLGAVIAQWTRLYAATEDVHDAARFEREVAADNRVHTRGIEVGQVFYFGTKYSEPMKAFVTGPDGVERPIHGGSYGIGVSRLAGAIIEASHDDAGIVWPDAVAPFKVGLVNLKVGDAATDAACEEIYAALEACGNRRALRRHRRTRRRQVLHDGPDRSAVAARRRTARPRQRHCGAEAPRHGRDARSCAGRSAGTDRSRTPMSDLLWQKDGVAVDARIMRFLAGDDVVLDRDFFSARHRGEQSRTSMGLSRIGGSSKCGEASALMRELERLDDDFANGRFVLDERYEDGHSAIEARLIERLGDTGRKVHTGRSRNDQISGRDAALVEGETGTLSRSVPRHRGSLPRSRRARTAAVAGIHASATRGRFVDGAVVRGIRRSLHRRRGACARHAGVDRRQSAGHRGRLRRQPAAGSRARNRARSASHACRSIRSMRSSRAASSRSVRLDALGTAVLDLRRLAWDLSLFTTAEFGFVQLPAEYTTGSSIMPNKRNPDVVELMRATYATVAAARTEIEQLLSLPSGYQRDLQLGKGAIVRGFTRGLAALELLPDLLARMRMECQRACALRSSRRCMRPMRPSSRPSRGVPFREAYRSAADRAA